AAVAFIAFALWRIWQEVSPRMPEADRSRPARFEGLVRVQRGLKVAWKPLVIQVGMAGLCVAALFVLSWFLTIGPRGRARSLSDYHERALTSAAAGLDLTAVRYHAAQLQLLDTDDGAERRHHVIALKAQLMRDVLARPT